MISSDLTAAATAWRAALRVVCFLVALSAAGVGAAAEFSVGGGYNVEGRWYPESGLHPGQRDDAFSFTLEPEFYLEGDAGWSVALSPFYRHDVADPNRAHYDVREAYALLPGDLGPLGWELRLGIEQVFWGVAESQRLVDVVNQIDFVEHPNGEAKLGQPAAHATVFGDWGTLELFALPYHRPRTFPGRRGRFRLVQPVPEQPVTYESPDGDERVDVAARYSHTLGPLDFGLSAFDGNNREPAFCAPNSPRDTCLPGLTQHYTVIRQAGLDAQLTLGQWLFKLEAIQRNGAFNAAMREVGGVRVPAFALEDYAAFVAGAEYTFYALLDSAADMTLFAEWHYDERGRRATPSRSPGVLEDDVFLAATLMLNDLQSTELGASLIGDLDRATYAVGLGLERRLSDQWSLAVEVVGLLKIDREEVHYPTRRDGFIEFVLSHYF